MTEFKRYLCILDISATSGAYVCVRACVQWTFFPGCGLPFNFPKGNTFMCIIEEEKFLIWQKFTFDWGKIDHFFFYGICSQDSI